MICKNGLIFIIMLWYNIFMDYSILYNIINVFNIIINTNYIDKNVFS